MSVPDHELDEPEICQEHCRELPCWDCWQRDRNEWAEEQFEAWKER